MAVEVAAASAEEAAAQVAEDDEIETGNDDEDSVETSEDSEKTEERFRVDRKKLEQLLQGWYGCLQRPAMGSFAALGV